MVEVLGMFRRVALEASRRIEAREPEAGSNAVFFLTLGEVRRVLYDENERVAIRVQRRRLEHDRNRALPEPPTTFVGFPPDDPGVASKAKRLRGLAASRGVAEGRVRILRDATQAANSSPVKCSSWRPRTPDGHRCSWRRRASSRSSAALSLTRRSSCESTPCPPSSMSPMRPARFVMVTSFESTVTQARWRSSVPERESAEPEIIHHDEHLLIVHKPPGLPTTAPRAEEPSLVRWVSNGLRTFDAHATSRLDSQVSGLVTFALTPEANRTLLDARRAGTYERVYLGITIDEVSVEAGDWAWPISIDPSNPKLRVAQGAAVSEPH